MFEDVDKNKTNLNQGAGGADKASAPSAPEGAPPTSPQSPRAGAEAEDIFADTEKAAPRAEVGMPIPGKPAIFQSKAPISPENLSQAEDKEGLDIKKHVIFSLVVLSAVVVFAGGWYGFNKFFKNADTPASFLLDESDKQAEDIKIIEETGADEDIIKDNGLTRPETVISTPQPTDTDQDGLTDKEEIAIGTDINNVDSDSDGLFDREEIEVYKTDPLNSDTDADGYLDGEEVKGGYNPKGEGRLFEIK